MSIASLGLHQRFRLTSLSGSGTSAVTIKLPPIVFSATSTIAQTQKLVKLLDYRSRWDELKATENTIGGKLRGRKKSDKRSLSTCPENLDVETIAEVTGLSIDQIKSLQYQAN